MTERGLGQKGRGWVRKILERSGQVSPHETKGIFNLRVQGELARLLNGTDHRFTFQRRLAGRDGAELAAPGSWLMDQLLHYSGEWGRTTQGFVPLPEGRRSFRGASQGEPKELLERRYIPVFQFTWRLTLYTSPPAQELISLAWHSGTGRTLKRGLASLLQQARPEPEEGIQRSLLPDAREGMQKVWQILESEIETRVKFLAQSGAHEQETKALGRFYNQLIQEEKYSLRSAKTSKVRQEIQEKLDLLKLEWERRISEVHAGRHPQVIAGLCGVALLHLPAELWRRSGSRKPLWLDPVRGDTWEEWPKAGPRTPWPAQAKS